MGNRRHHHHNSKERRHRLCLDVSVRGDRRRCHCRRHRLCRRRRRRRGGIRAPPAGGNGTFVLEQDKVHKDFRVPGEDRTLFRATNKVFINIDLLPSRNYVN